jgi:hypothetical protein
MPAPKPLDKKGPIQGGGGLAEVIKRGIQKSGD